MLLNIKTLYLQDVANVTEDSCQIVQAFSLLSRFMQTFLQGSSQGFSVGICSCPLSFYSLLVALCIMSSEYTYTDGWAVLNMVYYPIFYCKHKVCSTLQWQSITYKSIYMYIYIGLKQSLMCTYITMEV